MTLIGIPHHKIYRNRNKFINQIRAPGWLIQITIMIDTQQQYIKLKLQGNIECFLRSQRPLFGVSGGLFLVPK